MGWKKLGLVFNLQEQNIPWLKSHAMVPTPLLFEDKIRVFYAGRSNEGESKIGYVDFMRDDPTKILYVHDKPIFDVGPLGTFDDSGTLSTCAVRDGDNTYIFYTAYSMSVKVPYRNSIGIAISTDGGNTFKRMFDGPIVDRSKYEPYFVISPWVVKRNNLWHMWYSSATNWILVDDKPESVYHIKYAHSTDGINWVRENASCILPVHKEEANARPTVIENNGNLKMWFTYRGSRDFRDGLDSYRIGYAESKIIGPTKWKRDDKNSGISPGPEEYDNLMQAYPAVIEVDGKTLLFYNGNGFGHDGFCCAEWLNE
jgi:predicted GH43/DUF377 family glycosyl hydrolase